MTFIATDSGGAFFCRPPPATSGLGVDCMSNRADLNKDAACRRSRLMDRLSFGPFYTTKQQNKTPRLITDDLCTRKRRTQLSVPLTFHGSGSSMPASNLFTRASAGSWSSGLLLLAPEAVELCLRFDDTRCSTEDILLPAWGINVWSSGKPTNWRNFETEIE